MHQLTRDQSMLWLGMGLGKQQPVSEPVLTPVGWVPIGSLGIGDNVIGSNGRPTKVIGVYPQTDNRVVKVTFNDGSYTRCGYDHLWNVQTAQMRLKDQWCTMSTTEIIESGLKQSNGLKWSVPLVQPVSYHTAQLPIDAYTLGVILGDGTVSERSGVTVCTDTEIIQNIGCSTCTSHKTSMYTGYGYIPHIKQELRDLGLMGKRSWEKTVPPKYLLADEYQRLSLLQGLLDTDGSPIGGGGVEFSSTSENLIDSVINLAESLGGIGRNKTPRHTRHQGGAGRKSWRVNVKLPSAMNPFRLTRKLDKWQRPTKYHVNRKIKSIEQVNDENSVCIMVDVADHLYVTRHHVVTHNTAITLTTIVDRMRAGQVQKTLIFGPLRVIQSVWAKEARKWEHTKHLRFSIVHGTKVKRAQALFAIADVYLVNYEAMNWLTETLEHYYLSQGKPLPFQMVVYDEISKLKNSTTLRVKGGTRDRKDRYGTTHKIKVPGWRNMIPHFRYRVGLTGTPASNGYIDLHGQYLVIDNGTRLGEYVTRFRDNYFQSDFMGWSYSPTPLGKQAIEQKISDITVKMDSKEYLDLPDVTITDLMVDMPLKARKAYEEVEREMFTRLDNGDELEVFSRSSVSNKCLQIANGSPYLEPGQPEYTVTHDAKLDALEDVMEEASGSPVLCSYSFRADADRIMKKFRKLKPVNLTAESSRKTESIIEKWNRGELKLMIGHCASMSHGIDGLQDSGHTVVWFGLNYSLELYDQMNARIDRQGQRSPVSIIRILCNDTVDVAVADALSRKTDDQEGLKNALQRYRNNR